MSLIIRSVEQNDTESCGKVGYEAHKTISSAHGYPSEQPSEQFGIEQIRKILGNPNSWGVLAERHGKILGSIFLEMYEGICFPISCHDALLKRPMNLDCQESF